MAGCVKNAVGVRGSIASWGTWRASICWRRWRLSTQFWNNGRPSPVNWTLCRRYPCIRLAGLFWVNSTMHHACIHHHGIAYRRVTGGRSICVIIPCTLNTSSSCSALSPFEVMNLQHLGMLSNTGLSVSNCMLVHVRTGSGAVELLLTFTMLASWSESHLILSSATSARTLASVLS